MKVWTGVWSRARESEIIVSEWMSECTLVCAAGVCEHCLVWTNELSVFVCECTDMCVYLCVCVYLFVSAVAMCVYLCVCNAQYAV